MKCRVHSFPDTAVPLDKRVWHFPPRLLGVGIPVRPFQIHQDADFFIANTDQFTIPLLLSTAS